MNDILEQHKRFLVSLVGGALAFLIGWAIIGAMTSDDIRKHERNIKRNTMAARNAIPAGVDIPELKRSAVDLESKIKKFGTALARDPGSFTLRGAGEPDLHFNTKVQELLGPTRMQALALMDVSFDEGLGRPDKYPNNRAAFEWNLRGLDVVDQLMQWVMGATQEELGGVIKTVEKVEILPAPKRRGMSLKKRNMVTMHPVRFTVTGHPIGIAYLIEKLAEEPTPGRWLAVLEAHVESLDVPASKVGRGMKPSSTQLGMVSATFLVAAVDIDWEGAPEAPKAVR